MNELSGKNTGAGMSQQAETGRVQGGAGPRRPRSAVVALWVGVIALALNLFLVLPYLARGLLALLPAAAVVLATGAIVLAVRSRSSADPRRTAGRAVASAVVAAAAAAALLAVFLFTVVGSRVDQVEVRGQGPDGTTATFSSEGQSREETWNGGGTGRVATAGRWAELTLMAPADAADQNVSCQILWNGEVVVDETSGSGTVTCRYDEN